MIKFSNITLNIKKSNKFRSINNNIYYYCDLCYKHIIYKVYYSYTDRTKQFFNNNDYGVG